MVRVTKVGHRGGLEGFVIHYQRNRVYISAGTECICVLSAENQGI